MAFFFEDINYGADGGLYAEMVKNRSFEFPQSLMGWNTFSKVEVRTEGAPFPNCPHYVHLTFAGNANQRLGMVNEGYFISYIYKLYNDQPI
jgi:alpha-N-arabinofuranosidase